MINTMSLEFAPVITDAMLEPVVEMFSANIAVAMPVALALYGIIKGVGLVPRIIGMFVR